MWRLRLGTALVCVLLMSQICGIHAAECSEDAEADCCEGISRCPDGYYENQEACPSTTLAQQSTTTAISTTEVLEDDTNTTQSNTTEGTPTSVSTEPTANTSESTTNTTTTFPNTTSSLNTSTAVSTPGTTVYCTRCEENCKTCNSSGCIECEGSFKRESGKCVRQGAFPLAAVIGGSVGGVVVVVIIIVVVVVCIKRRRPTPDYQPSNLVRNDVSQHSKPDTENKENDGVQVQHTSSNPIYENIPRGPGNLPVQIPRKQDSVLRYTRDPTLKRTAQAPTGDEASQEDEEEAEYANQEAFILNTLGEAPAPPTHAQTTVRRKEASDDIDQTGHVEDTEELYENNEVDTASSVNKTKDTDDPVYENYGFHVEDETPK